MTSRHLLRHLAIAYRHFHPIHHHEPREDPHRFFQNRQASEAHRTEEKFISQLAALEARCKLAAKKGEAGAVNRLLPRIKELKKRLASRMMSRLASRINELEDAARKI